MPRTTSLLKLLAFALACTLLTTPVPAQVNEGIVTGRAVDANNCILQGARVELQPKGVSTVTDAPGNFTIDNLAPGEYRLTVTFVGLASFEKNVTVTAGQATRVEAALQVAAQSDSIIVTAERPHSEAEAINRERTAGRFMAGRRKVAPKRLSRSRPRATRSSSRPSAHTAKPKRSIVSAPLVDSWQALKTRQLRRKCTIQPGIAERGPASGNPAPALRQTGICARPRHFVRYNFIECAPTQSSLTAAAPRP